MSSYDERRGLGLIALPPVPSRGNDANARDNAHDNRNGGGVLTGRMLAIQLLRYRQHDVMAMKPFRAGLS